MAWFGPAAVASPFLTSFNALSSYIVPKVDVLISGVYRDRPILNGTANNAPTDQLGGAMAASMTFTATDAGTVVFPGGVTLITEGDQTVTATDTVDGTITGTATVTVTSGNAPRLVWTLARQPATPATVPLEFPAPLRTLPLPLSRSPAPWRH